MSAHSALHHLQSFRDGFNVFLRFESERRDGVASWIVSTAAAATAAARPGIVPTAAPLLRRGVVTHDGRGEVAGVAGLRMRQEAGQDAHQWRRQPGVAGQSETRTLHAAQGAHRVVVVETQTGGLHLFLAAPFGASVLKPDLTDRKQMLDFRSKLITKRFHLMQLKQFTLIKI